MLVEREASRAFDELVRGRRIAVAGPARSLEGRRQGPLIDSFDLVVRFNDVAEHLQSRSWPARDFGRRADILYCNQVILRTHALGSRTNQRAFLDAIRTLGVKFIVCTNNSLSFDVDGLPTRACPAADRRVAVDVAMLLAAEGLATRCRMLHATPDILHRWLEGHWARTGFLGLFDLMNSPASRLYLTGMTFYHEGGHVLADPGATLHPQKNRDGSWARSAEGVGHDSYLEREIMRWLACCYRRTVSVDEDLLRILGYTTAPEHWRAESDTSSASSTAEPS